MPSGAPHDLGRAVVPRVRLRNSEVPLAERQVFALERIASAEEERNRQIRADAVERREAWAVSEAKTARMLEIAEDAEAPAAPPRLRASRRGTIRGVASHKARDGVERRELTVEIAPGDGVAVGIGDEVEVIFLALRR